MDQEPVAKFQMLALVQPDEVGAAPHGGEAGSVSAERVGSHQPVIATVPARRIAILRMIQNCHADGLSVYGTRVVAPCRQLAPAVFLPRFALGILNFAVAAFLRDSVVDADAKGP